LLCSLCTWCIVGIFRSNSLFIGSNVRGSVNEGRADFTPIFLSEVPLLFRRKILNLDVALIQVSPPDNHGFCTLGPSVDTTRAAIQNAKFIVGMSVCLRVCLFVGGGEETLCLLKDGSQNISLIVNILFLMTSHSVSNSNMTDTCLMVSFPGQPG